LQLEYFIASLPPPACPSAPAQARQQLYAEGKFAKEEIMQKMSMLLACFKYYLS
jgi:hypothetical protein